jgi:hypothetical protein
MALRCVCGRWLHEFRKSRNKAEERKKDRAARRAASEDTELLVRSVCCYDTALTRALT